MFVILSVLFTLTPIPTLSPIYEEIRLTDNLVIRAEYLPIDRKSEREGMLLTVEDFIILRNELEFSGVACEGRIDALTKSQTQQIDAMMVRCERQYNSISLELEGAKTRVTDLESSLKSEREWNSFYSWVTIGLSSVLVGTGVYIILGK